MNIQVENGYTRIANELYEEIMKQSLNGYESRVLHAIIRKTYGYGKTEDFIALSQIETMTNISKSHVSRTISNLIRYGIVTKLGNGLGINKDCSAWKVTKLGNSKKAHNLLPKMDKALPKLVKGVTKLGIKSLPKTAPQKTKDNITKENTTKDMGIFLEEFNKKFDTNYRATSGRIDKFKTRLKTYSVEEIFEALVNLSTSEWHKGKNDRGWKADPDFLLRSDEQIDKFLNYTKPEHKSSIAVIGEGEYAL